MAPQKGKQGTKGSKQIMEENIATLKFYRNMAGGGTAIYLLILFLCIELSAFTIIFSIISIGTLFAAYQFMAFMCKPKLSETGAVLDTGSDLNMKDGIAEHVKDLIILVTGTQILSLLSNWFWLLLLLAPARTGFMLWGSVIKPWLSQKSEQPEMDEKKQKKMERKAKRMR